ncbi:DNA/RNA non-specific endonuclease [Kribbella sp. CA-247076]|uniref:DNA/RNA non-specific endonuclease n=1 Tax=Kribbella sp. CA-247076 TaxID=3239941 RepID=UPI003D89C768
MSERPPHGSERAEQAADPADVEAVGYGPGDVVQVPDRYAELPVYKEKSGRAGRWNDNLSGPDPSSVYVVDDRYLYATDRAGRVTHAEGWLGWLPSKENDERRNLDAQRAAGEPDRQWNDDGGHLFATKFDGPGEAINLTAQSRTQNQAVKGSDNWRRMEESWQALRAAGIQVHASIDVRYADGTSRRPSARAVVDRHEGRRSPRRIFKETTPQPTKDRE